MTRSKPGLQRYYRFCAPLAEAAHASIMAFPYSPASLWSCESIVSLRLCLNLIRFVSARSLRPGNELRIIPSNFGQISSDVEPWIVTNFGSPVGEEFEVEEKYESSGEVRS